MPPPRPGGGCLERSRPASTTAPPRIEGLCASTWAERRRSVPTAFATVACGVRFDGEVDPGDRGPRARVGSYRAGEGRAAASDEGRGEVGGKGGMD